MIGLLIWVLIFGALVLAVWAGDLLAEAVTVMTFAAIVVALI